MKKVEKRTIIIAGDTTIDWNIARVKRMESQSYSWNMENLTHAFLQRGGASLPANILETMAVVLEKSGRPGFKVRKPWIPDGTITPDDKRIHHTYALWKPFEIDSNDKRGKKVWRVSEFMGIRRSSSDAFKNRRTKNTDNEFKNPDLIILDDADLGFRDHNECWPPELSDKKSSPRIILKMSPVLATGKLWDFLKKNHAEQVIVLVNADDIRRHPGVSISHKISWERTAQDLVWEFLYNPQFSGFRMFAHTIVSFGTSGAILFSREKKDDLKAMLFFDPKVMEDDWNRNYPGGMIGYTSCLAAAVAYEIISNTGKPDLGRGIQTGVSTMRLLHKEGYGQANTDLEQNSVTFPVSSTARKIVEGENCLATVVVNNPVETLTTGDSGPSADTETRLWTILESQKIDSLEQISKKIVREGLESALPGVPVARFGKLTTVDRKEIEALNCVGSLLREYCQQSQNSPISIAVFGAPGSGKSFAIKQVANWIQPGEFDPLTFNISQLSGPNDLLNAFHQVRDKALSGKIPLVFWDEFDTTLNGQQLGWLRYFLAPMQDGEFQEGQITHPIGKSIFVFAGGTSYSMDSFSSKTKDIDYRDSKLPDFISRLRGFLNILGPNCQAGSPAGDPYYIIRRAILLRSLLERNTPQLLHGNRGKTMVNIDEGVLRALLFVKEYKHGARSMEGIILASQLAGKTSFGRSDLPTEAQLNLHTDGREFYSLVNTMDLDADMLEKVAEAAHTIFCDYLTAEGYDYGPSTSENEKIHSSLKPYRKLSEDEKEQNRNNVRDIPNKLAAISCAVVPLRTKEIPSELKDSDIMLLAKMEHDRWMREKIETGWKWAEETDKENRLHKSILPWDKLSTEEQEKDCVLIRGIPKILARAGYTIVKLH